MRVLPILDKGPDRLPMVQWNLETFFCRPFAWLLNVEEFLASAGFRLYFFISFTVLTNLLNKAIITVMDPAIELLREHKVHDKSRQDGITKTAFRTKAEKDARWKPENVHVVRFIQGV